MYRPARQQPALDSGSDTIVLPASLAFADEGTLWDGKATRLQQQGSDKFNVNCEEKLEMCFVLSDRVHLLAQRWDDRFYSHHLQEGQRAGFRLREYLLCYTSQPSNFLFRNL